MRRILWTAAGSLVCFLIARLPVGIFASRGYLSSSNAPVITDKDSRRYARESLARVPAEPGDPRFGLGLARNLSHQIDGTLEKCPDDPLLLSLPGIVGIGHADVVGHPGRT